MYLEFKNKMSEYPVFSRADIKIQCPKLDNRRLTEWQEKGYIEKLRNSYYLFSDQSDTEFLRFFISNTIYDPSYVSLQSALYFHGYIPEATFSVTAISTNKTKTFQSSRGAYLYKSIQPEAFLGYELITHNQMTIKMATPEKALVDFIYLNKEIRDVDAIQALRLNTDKMKDEFSFEKSMTYAPFFGAKVLDRMLLIIKELYA